MEQLGTNLRSVVDTYEQEDANDAHRLHNLYKPRREIRVVMLR